MKILLIGGAGFIGSRTALRLLEDGHDPVVMDSLDPQIHGADFRHSHTYRLLEGKVPVVRADTRDASALDEAMSQAEAVYYFPAGTGTGQSMYRVEHYCDVNVRGAGVFAEALGRHRASVRQVIVSSTRAVYGEGAAFCREHGRVFPAGRSASEMETGRFETGCPHCRLVVEPASSQETDPVAPVSIYGITKLGQEQIIANTAQNFGISCVAFRYQNVYGPGQSLKNPYTGILSIFTQLLLAGREVNLFEDGLPTRDFVHVNDVVEYNVRALKAEGFLVLNVGSGRRVTLVDLVEALAVALNVVPRYFISGQFRLGDIRHAAADGSALHAALGRHAFVPLEDGLRGLTEWVAAQQDAGANQRFDNSLEEMRAAGLLRTAAR